VVLRDCTVWFTKMTHAGAIYDTNCVKWFVDFVLLQFAMNVLE